MLLANVPSSLNNDDMWVQYACGMHVYVAIGKRITTVNVASSVFSIPTFKRVYYKRIFLVYRLSKYYDQNKLLN